MSNEWDSSNENFDDIPLPKAPEILSDEEYRTAAAADVAQWKDGSLSAEDQESTLEGIEAAKRIVEETTKAQQSQSNQGEQ